MGFQRIIAAFKGPRYTKDDYWAWLVCAAVFTVYMCTRGLQLFLGIFFSNILKSFGGQRGTTALIGSIYASLLFMFAPVSALLTERYGVRLNALCAAPVLGISLLATSFCPTLELIYVTFGIMGGISACLLATPCYQVLNYYFRKKINLAIGIASSGVPFSAVAFNYVASHALDTKGWRTLFRYMSVIIGILCTLSSLVFVPSETEIKNKDQANNSKRALKLDKFRQVLKLPTFQLMLLALVIGAMPSGSFATHLVQLALELNIPWKTASLLPMLGGVGNLIGRFSSGILYSGKCLCPVKVFQILSVLIGAITLLGALARHFTSIALLWFVYNVLSGTTLGVHDIPTFVVCGPDLFYQGWTIALFLESLVGLAGPPVIGWIVDANDDYRYLMYCSAVPFFLSALVLTPYGIIKRRLIAKNPASKAPPWADVDSQLETNEFLGRETAV